MKTDEKSDFFLSVHIEYSKTKHLFCFVKTIKKFLSKKVLLYLVEQCKYFAMYIEHVFVSLQILC